jgi:hypothetical protein
MQYDACVRLVLGGRDDLAGAGHVDEAQPRQFEMEVMRAVSCRAAERAPKRAAAVGVCLAFKQEPAVARERVDDECSRRYGGVRRPRLQVV